jgi:hypothetical protein
MTRSTISSGSSADGQDLIDGLVRRNSFRSAPRQPQATMLPSRDASRLHDLPSNGREEDPLQPRGPEHLLPSSLHRTDPGSGVPTHRCLKQRQILDRRLGFVRKPSRV